MVETEVTIGAIFDGASEIVSMDEGAGADSRRVSSAAVMLCA